MFTRPLSQVSKQAQQDSLLRNALHAWLTESELKCKPTGATVWKFPATSVVTGVLADIERVPTLVEHRRELGLSVWGRGIHIAVVSREYVDSCLAKVADSMNTSPTARHLGMHVSTRLDFSMLVLNDLLDAAEAADTGWTGF